MTTSHAPPIGAGRLTPLASLPCHARHSAQDGQVFYLCEQDHDEAFGLLRDGNSGGFIHMQQSVLGGMFTDASTCDGASVLSLLRADGVPEDGLAALCQPADARAAAPRGDFRFTSVDDLFPPGRHISSEARYLRNLNALNQLKQLRAWQRPATYSEQLTLTRYVGWGDSDVLHRGFNRHTGAPAGDLQALADKRDLDHMRASALNAHYTDLGVAQAMWDTLARLLGHHVHSRFRILDPSCGSGHFFSTMPGAFTPAQLYACELEAWTAGLFAQLHPSAQLHVGGFESAPYGANSFDLIVSNIPFGNYAVFDERMPDRALKASVHSYFFAKAAALLKPGGVIAFITSRYLLDSKSAHVRRHLARSLDLLGHVRLPSTAFETCAGTSVVTDIVFLRKRGTPTEIVADWAVPVDDKHNPLYAQHPERVLGAVQHDPAAHHAKQYVVRPLPDVNLTQALAKALLAQMPAALEPIVDALKDASRVSADSGLAQPGEPAQPAAQPGEQAQSGEHAQPAGTDVEAFAADFDEDAAANSRQRAMLSVIYGAAKSLIRLQVQGADDAEIGAARHALNEAYDAYVVRFGRLNGPHTNKMLKGHVFAPFLQALETFHQAVGWDKAALFHVNTVRGLNTDIKPTTPDEALAFSLNQFGAPRLSWMAEQLGMDEDALRSALAGLIFRLPRSRDFLAADVYLSGNLRDKLLDAEAAVVDEPDLATNIAALNEAMPPPLSHEDIAARLGAAWIPAADVKDFLNETLAGGDWRVTYLAALGDWTVGANGSALREGSAAAERWGTTRVEVTRVVDAAINSKPLVVWDELDDGRKVQNHVETELAGEKVRELLETFARWVWMAADRRARLVKVYNERFNVWRAPQWNGAHLALPGLSERFKPHPYQKDGVWQQVCNRASLLAYDVGAGKTATATMGLAECLRLGLITKGMVVVPNHLVSEWQREIMRLYPALTVIAPDPKDFKAANRKRMLSRIATTAFDVVVLAHSQYKLLPVSKETEAAFLEREIDQAQAQIAGGHFESNEERATLKEIEKMLKNLETKLKELNAMRKDATGIVTFEELGVQMVVIDEAHLFKNLFFVTRMGRIKGVTNASSQRAWDTYLKTRWLLESGRRVVYLTATPIANSMCEAHVFMRSLQAETLDRLDLLAFDAWARQFGEAVPGLELDPSGGSWRMVTRFAKFVNLPELGALWRQAMSVKQAKDLKLDQPSVFGGAMQPLVLPMSVWLKRIVDVLVKRAERVRSKAVEPKDDNMLKVTSDGRKAALDVRLFARELPLLGYSKVRAAARFAFAVWQASEPLRGTQMVFCDLSVPRGRDTPADIDYEGEIVEDAPVTDGEQVDAVVTTASKIADDQPPSGDDAGDSHMSNDAEGARATMAIASPEGDAAQPPPSVYMDFARELIALGVPAGEIAFVHQARNRREKQALFDKLNAGEIRFLLGSTERMGAGTNAQLRLINMIHLDPTWAPAGLIQRTGRIVRQGNIYGEVGVWCMQHEASFDVFMYQGLLRKISFISQALSGDLGLREMEDVGDQQLTFEDLTAAATGNPAVQRKAWLEREQARLSRLRRGYEDANARARIALTGLPVAISQVDVEIQHLQVADAWLETHAQSQAFAATLCSKLTFSVPDEAAVYSERATAGAQVIRLSEYVRTQALKSGEVDIEVGSYRGLRLSLKAGNYMSGIEVNTRLRHPTLFMLDIRGRIETAAGVFGSLDSGLRNFAGRKDAAEKDRAALLARRDELTAFVATPWDKTDELARVNGDLVELLAQFKKEAEEAAKHQAPVDAGDDKALVVDEALPAESYLPATEQVEKSWSKALAFVERVIEMHRDPAPLFKRLAEKGARHAAAPVAATPDALTLF